MNYNNTIKTHAKNRFWCSVKNKNSKKILLTHCCHNMRYF